MDADGDLDIYGLNWKVQFGLDDITVRNATGAGVYDQIAVMPGSDSDDNEADFMDYDCDGDLDVIVANFNGQERMYRNGGTGGASYVLASGVLPADSTTSLDSDACDVDADGDYDIFVANDANQSEWYLRNGTTNNDVTAPALYRLEQAPDRATGCDPTVVRVQVYDNAPYYITWYNDTRLEVQVNGGAVQIYPMQASQGQIFRGEIPGDLAGTITYRALSTDDYGNTGSTPILAYVSDVATDFCAGDNIDPQVTTDCPCLNFGAPGEGCANSFGAGGKLTATGTTNPDTVTLTASQLPPTALTIFLKGNVNNGVGVVYGDGVRCAGGSLIRFGSQNAVGGVATYPGSFPNTVSNVGGTPPGSCLIGYYQAFYRNADAGFCPPATFNITTGVYIQW
jgi:hypothetical protein